MAYRKLTKRQWKDRERILAWLEGKEFKENSRAKPAVPDLSMGEVLEFYVPPDVTGAGQFFTPAEMSQELLGIMGIPFYDDNISILDPCADIGHLLWPVARDTNHGIVAYEIEQECVKIGQRLFPKVEWHWEIPFEHLVEIENTFDFVVMNPPFNVTRGMAPGREMCKGRCTKSEHVFLELAVRACKPGGQIGVIAPYNFITRLPKALRLWLDSRVGLECEMGQLPGKFEMSSITVHGYIFRKYESEEPSGYMVGKEEWGGPTLAGVIPVCNLGHLPKEICPVCNPKEHAEFLRAIPLIHPQAKEMPDDYVRCSRCDCRVQTNADGLAVCQNCGMRAVFDVLDSAALLVENQQLTLF